MNADAPPTARPPPASLVLSRPDRVGDVILATACLAPLREALGSGARLFFAAKETLRPLLDGHPLLDGFVPLDQPPAALAVALRECRADALVHLHPDAAVQRAGLAAAIPRRFGYRSRDPWLDRRTLTDRLPDRRRAGRRHEAEYNFDLLAPFGVRPPPLETLCPSVHLAPGSRATLDAKLRALRGDAAAPPFVALNPTAFSPTLRWPAARFAHLAEKIVADLGLGIVLVGEHSSDPSVLEFHALTRGRFPSLAGQTDLAELGWLLRAACALVTRNTGASHLAAAVGCPVVELFGRLEPTYGPGRWRALAGPGRTAAVLARPDARRWFQSKPAHWQRSLAAIPVDEVFAALVGLL